MSYLIDFQKVLNDLPSEISRRSKILNDLYEDSGIESFQMMASELEGLRKRYYYRRKKYREMENDEDISKYMRFIHDTAIVFVTHDQRIKDILSNE